MATSPPMGHILTGSASSSVSSTKNSATTSGIHCEMKPKNPVYYKKKNHFVFSEGGTFINLTEESMKQLQ